MSLPCVNLVMKSLEYVCEKYDLNLEEVKSNLRKEEWWTQEYLCTGKLWCECVELSEKLSKSSSEEGKGKLSSGKGGVVGVILVGEKKISLPYNGTMVEMNCRCLKKNSGLYTQCENKKKVGCDYCSGCERNMKKKGESVGVPELGRIEDRLKCDILDFVCRNGEKPVRYMEYLKKCKVTKEEVLESAGRNNVEINAVHWLEELSESSSVSSEDGKGGSKGKGKGGSKGRPRKSKRAMEINKEEEEDIIAKIVSDVCASEVSEICQEVLEVSSAEEVVVAASEVEEKPVVKRGRGKKVSEEVVAEEKPVVKRGRGKKVVAASEEEEKPVVKRGRGKKVSEEEVVEEKKVVKKGRGKKVVAASEEVVEEEKMVTRSKGKKVASAEEDEEVEEDTVCHIEYEGKKYLKSKNTGVVYDYNVFKKEGDVKVVGMWNDAEGKMEYISGELSDEEYDD